MKLTQMEMTRTQYYIVVTLTDGSERPFYSVGTSKDLPLWYYSMKEAESAARAATDSPHVVKATVMEYKAIMSFDGAGKPQKEVR